MNTVEAADSAAIRDLVDRYAAAVDDRRFEQLADLFVADGMLVAPDPPSSLGPTVAHEGTAAIVEAMAALADFTATFHAVHAQVLDAVSSDEVSGRVTCTAHHLIAGDDKHRDLVWHLVYRDRYRRTDAGWRIARRELQIVSISTTNPRSVGASADAQEEHR